MRQMFKSYDDYRKVVDELEIRLIAKIYEREQEKLRLQRETEQEKLRLQREAEEERQRVYEQELSEKFQPIIDWADENDIPVNKLPRNIQELNEVSYLTLNNLNLSHLPQNFCFLNKLERLILCENQFNNFPEVICKLLNLKELYINKNNISSIPDDILKLKNLIKIDITENPLYSLPEYFYQLDENIFISKKSVIEEIQERLSELPYMELYEWAMNNNIGDDDLYSRMQLRNSPYGFSYPEVNEVYKLKLNDLGLDNIHNNIILFKHIILLDVSNNKLSTLPEKLGELTQLKEINICNNEIITLPESIYNLKNLKKIYIDQNQYKIIENIIPKNQNSTNDSLVIEIECDEKLGLLNGNKLVIPAIYDDFKYSNEHNNIILCIRSLDKNRDEISYINISYKKEIIKFIVSKSFSNYSQPFSNSLAITMQQGILGQTKWCIIDLSGNVVFSCNATKNGYLDIGVGYRVIRNFHCDLAAVGIANGTSQLPSKWGFIDKKGNIIIEPNYVLVGDFSEDLAAVIKESNVENYYGVGFIDINGNICIEPQYQATYDNKAVALKGFKNGLAIVFKDNKWGVIDKKNQIIINFYYDDIFRIKNNSTLFMVKIDDLYGIIDCQNQVIFEIKYHRISELEHISNLEYER